MLIRLLAASIFLFPLGTIAGATEKSAVEFREYAYSGSFDAGVQALLATAERDKDDMEAKFGAGMLQFFSAVSNLQNNLYRYGTGNVIELQNHSRSRGMLPILRLLVPANPEPEVANYQAVRNIVGDFVGDMAKTRDILASFDDKPVKLMLKPFEIGTDLNDDGRVEKNEKMLTALLSVTRRNFENTVTPDLTIVFGTADVSWLRGYTNLLMATGNWLLSYDFEKTYETSFQIIFGNQATYFGREFARINVNREKSRKLARQIKQLERKHDAINIDPISVRVLKKKRSVYEKRKLNTAENRRKLEEIDKQLAKVAPTAEQIEEKTRLANEIDEKSKQITALGGTRRSREFLSDDFFDAVSFIHSMNWKVIDAQKLASVRLHLLEVMHLNRITWSSILAETDNDHEWLPNTKQDGPMGFGPMPPENIESWLKIVDTMESVLKGETLLAHMRFNQGVNLKRFYEEAKSLDVILFATGPDALPYLESGKKILSNREWGNMIRPFGRNFGMFMVWFN